MTSFGAQIENPDQLMPTFKVKGQIYHRAVSRLQFLGKNHKFLQLYFISDRNSELNVRCEMSPVVERTNVSQLQHLFHENYNLVHLFKTAIDLMPTDTHKIFISADKRLLVKICVDTVLKLSTKWQSLWSVISFYLEILFYISETLSC